MDQREFLRQMEGLVKHGRSKGGKLTKKEIADYCGGLSLSGEQLLPVYAYLKERRIQVEGVQERPGNAATAAQQSDAKERRAAGADSRHVRLYRQELRQMREHTPEEKEQMFCRLLRGEEQMVPAVIEMCLGRVVTLAGKYRGRGVPMEDLIQEGNLELTSCVAALCGNQTVTDCQKAIDHAVRSRMIEMVDEALADIDSVSTVLARVNLLLEATRTLAEEYGRIATVAELSEFTHMDSEEIRQYVEMSGNEIEVGMGETSGGT